jgi:hypothetical protein
MNAQEPAYGIMQTGDFEYAKSFRISCACHSSDHDVYAWIEVDRDHEEPVASDVQLTFYVAGTTPIWKKGFGRIQYAWNVLVKGYHQEQHELILNEQAAINLADAITKTVAKLRTAKSSK